MGSINDLPNNATFGVPKQNDPAIVVSNPPNQVWNASEHDVLAQRLIQLFADVGISAGVNAFTSAGSLWREIGKPDGSTGGSLWQAVAALQSAISGTFQTVVWRPSEPSPSGNVFSSWGTLYAAILGLRGRVEIYIDTTLGAASIPAGAYTLACSHLSFVGTTSATQFTIPSGVTFTGPKFYEVENATLLWTGASAVFQPAALGALSFLLKNQGAIAGQPASAGPLIYFPAGTVGVISVRDELCAFTTTGYELVTVDATSGAYLFIGNFCQIGPDVVRGAGDINIVGNSANLNNLDPTQTNLSGTLTISDGAVSAPVMAALHAAAAARTMEVIWRPLGVAGGNVFTSWFDVWFAIQARQGTVRIIVDDTLGAAEISGGAYTFACSELVFVAANDTADTNVIVKDAVTFTAPDIVRMVVDGVHVSYRGATSALFGAQTKPFTLHLVHGGQIIGHASAAVEMFNIDLGIVIRMDNPLCSISTLGYELFDIAGPAAAYVYAGFFTNMGDDVIRGLGSVFVIHNSMNGSAINTTQTNLTTPMTVQDGYTIMLDPTFARIDALEAPAASARVRIEPTAGGGGTGAFTWNVATYKRLSILFNTAKFALTLSSTDWTPGEERQLDVDNAGGFGVEVILANGAHVLNNQGAGVGYTTLPGSTTVPDANTLPASFQITYMGGGAWKIR